MSSPVVELTEDEVEHATELARATHQRYRNQQRHYRNLARSHLLGKLSEIGTEKWLRSVGLDPDPAYRDPARVSEPDLLVGPDLEIKTWRPDTWDAWGRCVTPAQAAGVIAKKASAVIWTVTDDEGDPPTVTVVGWSTPEDIVAIDPVPTGLAYRTVVNHQVAVEDLRDLSSLLEMLRSA